MEKYISREVILAEQYFEGKEIEGVQLGKNDPYNRWDDTPDGPYIQREGVRNGDWVVSKRRFQLSRDLLK